MAVVYPDDIKAARMNAVKNALGVDGKLEIGTTGTAVWEYCSVANADIQVNNVDVTLGEAFQIDSASITHA